VKYYKEKHCNCGCLFVSTGHVEYYDEYPTPRLRPATREYEESTGITHEYWVSAPDLYRVYREDAQT
jgi:hypothetical protein